MKYLDKATRSAYFKKLILILADIIAINAAYILAAYFSDINFSLNIETFHFRLYVFITGITITVFYFVKFYSSIWRYAGLEEILRLLYGVSIATGVTAFFEVLSFRSMRAKQFVIAWSLQFIFIIIFRAVYRFLINHQPESQAKKPDLKRVLIIGAGGAGVAVVRHLVATDNLKPVVFIDDDREKKNFRVCGIPVVGGREKIADAVLKYKIDIIVLAIPSLCKEERKKIIQLCLETNAEIRTIPSIQEILLDKRNLSNVRKLDFSDFLGRDEVNLNVAEVSGFIENSTVLVTGGGGSIGSELCRQIAKFSPKKIIVFDVYENNAYDLQVELNYTYSGKLDLDVIIGSVRDLDRLDEVFDFYKPDIVIHAAAHKHVPLMEFSPAESVKNNIFGTLNAVQCADKYGVKTFVLISTDKAVNPTNVMGATKRIAEMIIQWYSRHSKTKFVAVRFGNVLGSNGSVIPLFQRQIAHGGPVTVTHPDIIRYFMTIPEAAQLVLQAGAIAKGGEVFILDMGEPVKIVDLAEKLILFEGLRPNVDIKIEFTGLRPGEKLFEELLLAEEGVAATKHNKIFVAKPTEIEENLLSKINELRNNYNSNELLRKNIESLIGRQLCSCCTENGGQSV